MKFLYSAIYTIVTSEKLDPCAWTEQLALAESCCPSTFVAPH